ncbi:MAG: type II toxin-antitoxin system Phd/YefM family antitoxin [Acidimicrobiales bacterium]
MTDIPARDLRNDVSSVLRRVEHGEHLRVTVSGRPVAELRPLPTRPRSMAWNTFFRGSDRWQADPELARELSDLLPETTDDLPIA